MRFASPGGDCTSVGRRRRRGGAPRGRSTRRSRSPRRRRRRPGPTAWPPRSTARAASSSRRWRIQSAARKRSPARSTAGARRQAGAAADGRGDRLVRVGGRARRRGGHHDARASRIDRGDAWPSVCTCSPPITRRHVEPEAVAHPIDGHREAPPAPRPAATRAAARGRTGAGRAGRWAATTGASVGPGMSSTVGRRDQLVERAALGEAVAHEALVRRVLQQPPHQVGHARHQLADRPVHAQAQAEPLDRGVHGLGHAVEHLHLVAVVGDAPVARVAHRVGERAQVVGAERGPHLAVVVVQEPDAALVAGVGLVLVLEDRRRPAAGAGVDRLGVPVGALHEPHRDRACDGRSTRR